MILSSYSFTIFHVIWKKIQLLRHTLISFREQSRHFVSMTTSVVLLWLSHYFVNCHVFTWKLRYKVTLSPVWLYIVTLGSVLFLCGNNELPYDIHWRVQQKNLWWLQGPQCNVYKQGVRLACEIRFQEVVLGITFADWKSSWSDWDWHLLLVRRRFQRHHCGSAIGPLASSHGDMMYLTVESLLSVFVRLYLLR